MTSRLCRPIKVTNHLEYNINPFDPRVGWVAVVLIITFDARDEAILTKYKIKNNNGRRVQYILHDHDVNGLSFSNTS